MSRLTKKRFRWLKIRLIQDELGQLAPIIKTKKEQLQRLQERYASLERELEGPLK